MVGLCSLIAMSDMLISPIRYNRSFNREVENSSFESRNVCSYWV